MSLNLSIHDIMRHKRLVGREDVSKEEIYQVLYEMGMNTDKSVRVLYCIHRSQFTNKVHKGKLYEGTERTDEDWLVTKYMVNSLERYGHVDGHLLDGHSQAFMAALKAKQLDYYRGDKNV